jgi:hypothetical protein
MIHTASCSMSHRVGGRGIESVSQQEGVHGRFEAAEGPRLKAGFSHGSHKKELARL